ncbi:MAG TPA: diguanylate cyclase [Sulfurospirillum arcachonense]|nr:diguanylate cyclase [Sulfurospirillum arcachonense]
MVDYLKQITILYVEDEEAVREGYERALNRYCKNLYVAKDGLEGLELYKNLSPDIVISDINMPRQNGIEMAKQILSINKNQAILFTTAHTESEYTLEALNLNVDGYLIKPVDKKKLKIKLENIAKNIIIEQENIKNQKILQKILDNQSSITLLTNFETIEFASKSFYSLFGTKNKEEFFNLHPYLLSVFVNHKSYISGTTKEEFLKSFYDTKQEHRIVSTASAICDVKAFYIEIDMIDGLYILTLTDITELQKNKLDAEYKSTHDKLTTAYNRMKFEESLEIKYQSVLRYKRCLCLAIIDIDFFKKVNDDYGHQVGDEILKKLTKICLKNIRKTDLFARWGGEEFVLLMDETTLKNANFVCEKLRVAVENFKHPKLPQITISIGLSEVKLDDTKEAFFKRADDALYKAKHTGRNKVVNYE